MINPISFLAKEWLFFKKLSHEAQTLTLSFGLYSLADPILWTFVNAFLWRETNNVTLIALYNLFLFAGLPIGFYFNGIILKRFKATKFLMFGSLIQGVVVFILMFFSNISLPLTLVIGLIFGLASGFFWANKNYLALKGVKSSDRIYFSSLETVTATATGIIVPFFVGTAIVFGDSRHLYLPSSAYKFFAATTLIILFLSGYLLRHLDIQKNLVTNILVNHPSRLWQKFRLMKLLEGIFNGSAIFIPVLMVLILVGEEGSLGTIQAVASIISAIAIYFISKRASQKDQIKLIGVGVTFTLFASLFFGLTYSALGVIVYFLLDAISSPFYWSGLLPLANDTIDHVSKGSDNHDYSFIFDEELFLNIGRIVGIGFFVILTYVSTEVALRVGVVILAASQLLLLKFCQSIHQSVVSSA